MAYSGGVFIHLLVRLGSSVQLQAQGHLDTAACPQPVQNTRLLSIADMCGVNHTKRPTIGCVGTKPISHAPVKIGNTLSRPVLQHDSEIAGDPDPEHGLRIRVKARQIRYNVQRVDEPHLTAHDGAESLRSASVGSPQCTNTEDQISPGA